MRPVKNNIYKEKSFIPVKKQIENLQYLKILIDDYLNTQIPNLYYDHLIQPFGSEIKIWVFLKEDFNEKYNKSRVLISSRYFYTKECG